MLNSVFYHITAQSGGGGVVHGTKPVTTINRTFINSTTANGKGGIVHSDQTITVHNSTFINSSANGVVKVAHYTVETHSKTFHPIPICRIIT